MILVFWFYIGAVFAQICWNIKHELWNKTYFPKSIIVDVYGIIFLPLEALDFILTDGVMTLKIRRFLFGRFEFYKEMENDCL